MSKLPDFLTAHLGINGADQSGSGATSPGGEWTDDEGEQRYRPRTYPYHQYLPYDVEDEAERQGHLYDIIRNLYIAIEAQDFSPGAVRWSRELRGWLSLKFDPPRKTRAKLVKLYYRLAMAPGLDPTVSERFASMFMTLTKYISKSPPCYYFFTPSATSEVTAILPPVYYPKNAKRFEGVSTICVQGKT